MGQKAAQVAIMLIGLLVMPMAIPSTTSETTENSDAFTISRTDDGFTISLKDVETEVIQHSSSSPCVFLGKGTTSFVEHNGNFDVENYVEERIGLPGYSLHEAGDVIQLILFSGDTKIELELSSTETQRLVITTKVFPENYNRAWFRVKAQKNEHVYGAGEQFTYFDLRGHTFPIWTREQGNGRNKSSPVSYIEDTYGGGAGGDYYTTYFAVPTFVSSRRFYCHVAGSNYMELDFTSDEFHEIFIVGKPTGVYFSSGENLADTLVQMSRFFKTQPILPEWVSDGAILGVQGGTERVLEILTKSQANGLSVVGLWIQDWAGEKFTAFGKRVFWNWQWNEQMYPGLDTVIKDLDTKGVKLLAYINPYLNKDGNLFKEAEEKGYFMKNKAGDTYMMVNGDNPCGTIDLTNPEAFEWFKGVIKTNIIEFGFGGWMADYSEYTPTDGVFHNGMPGDMVHNMYPTLFARLNREAVEEAGKLGQVMFFMRSGSTGSQEYNVLTWAGDQNVDFCYEDGLASTIPAALSLGMSGFGLTHYDIGGFTTFVRQYKTAEVTMDLNMTRSEELFFRGAEMAVFTPVMRSHEGNKPTANFQVYSSDESLTKFAVLVNMFKALKSYTRQLQEQNAAQGIPLQRPLFLHYENDPTSYTIKYEYMYGPDLLVAPVVDQGASSKEVYLPPDEWVYLYDGSKYEGPQWVTVPAPSGKPPVFYRAGTTWKDAFDTVRKIAVNGRADLCGQENSENCPDN